MLTISWNFQAFSRSPMGLSITHKWQERANGRKYDKIPSPLQGERVRVRGGFVKLTPPHPSPLSQKLGRGRKIETPHMNILVGNGQPLGGELIWLSRYNPLRS